MTDGFLQSAEEFVDRVKPVSEIHGKHGTTRSKFSGFFPTEARCLEMPLELRGERIFKGGIRGSTG
jgi:hypothetical protein